MPFTKEYKAVLIEETAEKLESYPMVYLTNFSGLSVAEVNELRGRFRAANVEYKVVKNTLAKRAMDRVGGYEDLYEFLHGPLAIAFSEEPAAPARVIKDFTEEHKIELPQLKAAFIDGAFYSADQLDELASLKSKDELVADILALLTSPMKNVVSALQGQGSTLVGAIQQIAEGKSE